MNRIVIQVPSKSDLKWLLELVRRLGFESIVITEEETRLLAKQKLSAIIRETVNEEKISLDEIDEIVDQVRTERIYKKH
ncbi:MAG: hypothetical protein R2825_16000 [Saprospiraceae bacterium]